MKKLYFAFFLIFLNLLFSFKIAGAVDVQEIINDQNRSIQNQQQIDQNRYRQAELQQIENERKNLGKKNIEIVKKPVDTKCVPVKRIIFAKNKIFSAQEEQKFSINYIDKCLTKDDEEKLLGEISQELIKKGHITSKVKKSQEITNGELLIEISHGTMEDLIFNNDNFFDKTQKFMAFGPIKRGKHFDLHNIETGLDQINRLPSNHATVKILPGAQPNSSIVLVQNKPQNSVRLSLGFDDLGSRSTGKHRDIIGLAADNLLHLNDNLNITRSANDFTQKKELGRHDSVNVNYSIPYKGNVLTLTSSRYSYSLQRGDDVQFKARGTSINNSAMLDSAIIKQNKYRLNSTFSLTAREVTNYVGEEKIISSSFKSTVAAVSLPNTILFEKSSILLKPTYSKGLKILNAKQDDAASTSTSPHAQFDSFKFYGNYTQNLEIPRYKIPFIYSLTFDSQLAKQKLYSNDQFFIGGPFTVRGFENGSIGADSGYLIKNEVKFNLGKTISGIAPGLENSRFYSKWFNNISITPFYDYGYVKAKGGLYEGRLAGTGFRTSFNYKKITANLTYSWVANKSHLLAEKYYENQAVYFDVTTEFGFF